MITIGKNRKRFIAEIFKNATNCKVHTLENYYIGKPCEIKNAELRLWDVSFSKLTCDFQTGECTVRVTAREFWNFTVDPAILKAGIPHKSAKTPTVDFDSLFVESIVAAQKAYDEAMQGLEYRAHDPTLQTDHRCSGFSDARIKGIGGGTTLGKSLKQWCNDTEKCTMRVGKEWERWQLGVWLHLKPPDDDRSECFIPKKIAATVFLDKLKTVFADLAHVTIEPRSL